jgi:mono/diheme cytochrome c family protein
MKVRDSIYALLTVGVMACLSSCGAGGDNPGYEYAPQMYNSVAYEPLNQIDNEQEGAWLSSREDGKGEFYNSNVNNPHKMNMREPVANTVPRTKDGSLPYRLKAFELEEAAKIQNPLPLTPEVVAQGKVLYNQYCIACHGANGEGDGKAGEVLGGVANLKGGAYINLPEGHIFHVIMKGKGRMGAHGSQIPQERIWKIVHYVKQEIQKQ